MSDLEEALAFQIKVAKLPEPAREWQFAKVLGRRWRFDFAWPSLNVAVEVEGGTWVNGAHSRGKHFESDAEKYNTAALMGWRVLRFNNHMVNDGRALQVIEEALR